MPDEEGLNVVHPCMLWRKATGLVAGLARYVKDDDTKTRMYFRNIAMNEMPEVVTADMCTTSLPVCDPSALAPWS